MWHLFPPPARQFLGIEFNPVSHLEKLISAIGGFLSIWLMTWISYYFVGTSGTPFMVASMGASVVLLFAVPHGALSQPWPLLMGHLVPALVGVSCAKLIPNLFVAAALTVALSITVMHYLRCIHPPGGATALIAVIGGPTIQSLGYQYVITPVLLNVSIILLTAVVFNYFFPWRRYPACLKKSLPVAVTESSDTALVEHPISLDNHTICPLSQSDLEYALKQLNSFIDVTEEDLENIYALAVQHAQANQFQELTTLKKWSTLNSVVPPN